MRTSIGLNPKTKLIAGVAGWWALGEASHLQDLLGEASDAIPVSGRLAPGRQQMDSQPQTGLPPLTMSGPGQAPPSLGLGVLQSWILEYRLRRPTWRWEGGGAVSGSGEAEGGMDSGLEGLWSPPPPWLHQSQKLHSQPYYRVDFPVRFYLREAFAETIAGHQMIPQPPKRCQLWSFHSTHLPKSMGLLW